MTLLTIDPSVVSMGAAVFEGSTLTHCARLRPVPHPERLERVRCAARDVASWCRSYRIEPPIVAVEWPQIYQRGAGRTKGDPNDLIALAAIAGAIAALFPCATVRSVLPAEWKGQITKDAMGARILSRLTPTELALVPASHDAIDAVGIGLHVLGRLEQRRVFPGATHGRAT